MKKDNYTTPREWDQVKVKVINEENYSSTGETITSAFVECDHACEVCCVSKYKKEKRIDFRKKKFQRKPPSYEHYSYCALLYGLYQEEKLKWIKDILK